MAWWSEYTVVCLGCKESHLQWLCETGTHKEPVLWCPNCGTVLIADPHAPISMTDWHLPLTAYDKKSGFRQPHPRFVKPDEE